MYMHFYLVDIFTTDGNYENPSNYAKGEDE
jgi:hypothetical protein